jgi:hypothetical protein
MVTLALAKGYTESIVTIGGTLTSIIRRPTDGMLQITYTPTTGSPIIFDAGIVPAGRSITAAAIRTTDGHLVLTFDDGATLDTGQARGDDGETPQLQVIQRDNSYVMQYRFATQAPTTWTDLYIFPSPYTYTHTQTAPADVWSIQHNLGGRPVTILTVDATGEQIVGRLDAAVSTVNLTVIRFSEPIAGIAYIKF